MVFRFELQPHLMEVAPFQECIPFRLVGLRVKNKNVQRSPEGKNLTLKKFTLLMLFPDNCNLLFFSKMFQSEVPGMHVEFHCLCSLQLVLSMLLVPSTV